mmetsp:Transcript_8765/g.24961  ORF Transcript_8765/g.24961 Transcript_8765/m.24961 type:complete len:211 (-) Transcript_8765:2383-3015(-)
MFSMRFRRLSSFVRRDALCLRVSSFGAGGSPVGRSSPPEKRASLDLRRSRINSYLRRSTSRDASSRSSRDLSRSTEADLAWSASLRISTFALSASWALRFALFPASVALAFIVERFALAFESSSRRATRDRSWSTSVGCPPLDEVGAAASCCRAKSLASAACFSRVAVATHSSRRWTPPSSSTALLSLRFWPSSASPRADLRRMFSSRRV